MSKRRTADQIQRLLREADRDRAKGLTLTDICRKFGISQLPITAGASGSARRKWMTHGGSANWRPRSIGSSVFVPS